MERTANGATMQTVELINQIAALKDQLPPPLQREVATVLHKMTYPMREILAQVPGDSLTRRAQKLKVSRQTFYVWLNEKFRPTRMQAKRISRVTGVPIEHIIVDGWETKSDVRRKAKSKTARVAARRPKAAKRNERNAPKRRRKLDAPSRAKSA